MQIFDKYTHPNIFQICGFLALIGPILFPETVLAAPPDKGFGINLTSVHPGAPTLPYVNLIKQSDTWTIQKKIPITPLDGKDLELTSDGWIRILPSHQHAIATVARGTHYPAGQYLVSYEGQGEILFHGDATLVARRNKNLLVDVKPKDHISISITKTDRTNPVRNIAMSLPGLEPLKYSGLFNPEYINYLKGLG